jgi:hypothetical protein
VGEKALPRRHNTDAHQLFDRTTKDLVAGCKRVWLVTASSAHEEGVSAPDAEGSPTWSFRSARSMNASSIAAVRFDVASTSTLL